MAQHMTHAPIYQQAVHPVRLLWVLQVISWLKPVLRIDRVPQWDWQTSTVGPALAGKASAVTLQN